MPEYLSPGVYVEEIELGARPIEGVSTSVAGMLGVTLRGPQEPRLVTGFEEFKRLYGGYLPVDQSTLPFAVEGFFNNGGQLCYVGRITRAGAATMTADVAVGDGALMQVSAIGPGDWANRIALKIDDGSLPQPRFKLSVMYWDVAPTGGGSRDGDWRSAQPIRQSLTAAAHGLEQRNQRDRFGRGRRHGRRSMARGRSPLSTPIPSAFQWTPPVLPALSAGW